MFELVKLIRERKWDSAVTWGLLVLLMVTGPIAIRAIMNNAINESPFVQSVEKIEEAVIQIQLWNLESMRESAVAAYNRVYTIEDIGTFTQNGIAIKRGLRVPEIREVLATIDLERTIMFERFFAGL